MWITILVMAIAVSLEPFRIGMTALLLNRPKPTLQLLAFLCGGFAMGITVGLVVLFVFRRRLADTTYLTLPRAQLMIGGLAMLVGAVLAANILLGRGGRRPELDVVVTRIGSLRPVVWLRQLLEGRSLWVAAVAGLGSGLPSVDYLAALAVILASRASATTQVAALLAFHAMAFAFVEIPLLAYLLKPEATGRGVARLNSWIRSRRRLEVAILLLAVGGVLVTLGIVGN
ncbi:GAP family protein [Mycobacterium asiaticum]|uniref:GAP family protein n=1 Tax=Mycobacterium asiaticum TaxID=1790 RepID=UPI00055C2299|nr:GAP family protein [Mycobacterium asiaticum]OBJ48037.1 hypothetical protein A9W94_04710 [Mycobacterium asiaticum]ORA13817.1 hypothetical protein BST16_13530 [Mycobacterium asiaticum DSM 44297]